MLNLVPNPGKNLEIKIRDEAYYRYPIKTHQVAANESYLEIIKTYALPMYKEGDIVSVSEKIISLCQNRIVHKKDIKVGFLARFLSRFVNVTPAGEAVGNVYKMQLAINLAGSLRILFAAFCSAVTKLFGIKGVFYKVAGNEISAIDGFCNDAFDDYLEMGIFSPVNPADVCNEIKKELGITCMIVDANDIDSVIMGRSKDLDGVTTEFLKALIKDNPAGQGNEQTPIILIRKETAEELAAPTKELDLEIATSTDELS